MLQLAWAHKPHPPPNLLPHVSSHGEFAYGHAQISSDRECKHGPLRCRPSTAMQSRDRAMNSISRAIFSWEAANRDITTSLSDRSGYSLGISVVELLCGTTTLGGLLVTRGRLRHTRASSRGVTPRHALNLQNALDSPVCFKYNIALCSVIG